MRQEVGDLMVFVRGQTLQHIFQIGIGIMPIEPGALNQAHDRSGPQGACEQPVFSPDSNGSDLVLCPVVVDRQLPVTQEARQCCTALVEGRQALQPKHRGSASPTDS